ncbi:MAG: TolC family protein [Candidatus Bruticola sp.]
MNFFYSKNWLLLCAAAATALSLTQSARCSSGANEVPAQTAEAVSGQVQSTASVSQKSVRDSYTSLMLNDLEKMKQFRKEASIPDDAAELTLFQAEEYALKCSPILQSSKYSAMVTHEQLGQWLSNIYPSISFSAGFTHSGMFANQSERSMTDPITGQTISVSSGGGNNSSSRVNTGITVSQNLIDLSRRPLLRRAELAEAAALAELEAQRQEVLLNVRKSWFACYVDQTMLVIALENVHNKEARLYEARQHYETGLKAKSEVVSAESDLAAAQHEVVKAKTQLLVDWVTLNVSMGRSEAEPYQLRLDPYWEHFEQIDSEKLIKTAMSHRAELLGSQIALRSALNELDVIRSDYYPTLKASGSLGGSGSLSPFEGNWSLGVSLNWSLFDGYLRRYEESAQKIKARALAEDFQNQRLKIYQEVKSAEVSLRQSKASISSAEAAMASAKEKYRLAAARYKVGIGTNVEVSDAEVSLVQAQSDYASALNDLRVAKAVMIKALGVNDMDNLPEISEEIRLDEVPELPQPFNSGASAEKIKAEFPSLGENK